MDGSEQPTNPDGSMHLEPGATVSPRAESLPPIAEPIQPAPSPVPTPPQPSAPQPIVAQPPQQPVIADPVAPLTPLVPDYSSATPQPELNEAISWTASEFVAHQKSMSWYLALTGVAVIAALLVWLLTRDLISATVVLVAAGAFGTLGARTPRELPYRLDDSGLTIGPKHFNYGQFRSFAIVLEGSFTSIVFMPLKRFAPLTTIYYDPSDEPKIVALLSDQLPIEERQRDLVDRFMWRIRF